MPLVRGCIVADAEKCPLFASTILWRSDMLMRMARPLRFLIAAFTSAAISILIPLLAFRLNLWAGGARSMLNSALEGAIPLPLLIGVLAALWPSRRTVRPIFAGLFGGIIGFMFWYLTPRFLVWKQFGHWPGFRGHLSWDFDIEAMICWSAAAACGILLATQARNSRVPIATITLCLVALLFPDSIFNYVTQNQELTVAFIVPQTVRTAAAAPRTIEMNTTATLDVKGLAGNALELLRTSGVQGSYRVAELYRMGKGRPAWLLVVVDTPVSTRTFLPEPNRTTVVYVQNGTEWRKIPGSAPTLSRGIEIWPRDEKYGFLATYMIPDAAGAGVGGVIRKEDLEPFTPPPPYDYPRP